MRTHYRHPVTDLNTPLCDYCSDPEWGTYGAIATSPAETGYTYRCVECGHDALIDQQCHEEFHAPDVNGVCVQCEGVN